MSGPERGRYFEDFKVGDVYQHANGRTLTETDNTWFTLLTCNTNEIHFNNDYAAQTEFGRPLMNSCLTLAIATGLSVDDLSRNLVANLAWDKVTLPGACLRRRHDLCRVRGAGDARVEVEAGPGHRPGAHPRLQPEGNGRDPVRAKPAGPLAENRARSRPTNSTE